MENEKLKKIFIISSGVLFLIFLFFVLPFENNIEKQYDIYKTINYDDNVASFDSFKNLQEKTYHATIQASLHEQGDIFQVWINCIENGSVRIDSNVNISIWYPNGSIFINNSQVLENDIGQFLYNGTTPDILGVFSIEAKCEKNGNIAVAYDELQTITTFEKIKALFNFLYIEGDFKINSLAVNDVTFTDQSIKIAMSFLYKNGSEINFIPDSVNLTIYDSNGAVFDEAVLSDFVENDYLYSYSKSVGLMPDTGKYKIDVIAEKNGLIDKKTTLTRVASGGPFYIDLECPNTNSIGKDLYCVASIMDEGEAPVETSCLIYLDLNKNQFLDSDEVSVSFSKQTQPNELITIEKPLFIPANNNYLGLNNIQLQCEYIGSVLPDGFAHDTVLLTASSNPITEEKENVIIKKFNNSSNCFKIIYILLLIVILLSYILITYIFKKNIMICILLIILYTIFWYVILRIIF